MSRRQPRARKRNHNPPSLRILFESQEHTMSNNTIPTEELDSPDQSFKQPLTVSLASIEKDANTQKTTAPESSPEIDHIVGALGGLRLVPSNSDENLTKSEPELPAETEIPLSPARPSTAEKIKAPNKQHEKMIAETVERMQEGVKDGEWEMLYRSDEESVMADEDACVISRPEREEAVVANGWAEQKAANSYVNKLKAGVWSAWGRWRGKEE